MNAEQAIELYEYSQWAYSRVWRCIESLTEDQFTQEHGYSYGSLRNHFVHVLNAEATWLSRLQGQPRPAELNPADFPTRADVKAAWDKVAAQWRAYLASLDAAALDAEVPYMSGRGPRSDRAWQIITHVVNHGTDHRAQMLALLWQLGAPTVEQDYALFYWSATTPD